MSISQHIHGVVKVEFGNIERVGGTHSRNLVIWTEGGGKLEIAMFAASGTAYDEVNRLEVYEDNSEHYPAHKTYEDAADAGIDLIATLAD